MTRTRRTFTPEDRLSLLQEAEREGFAETCRKHSLSPTLLSLWRKKYLNKAADGLKPSYHRVDPQVKAFEQENERLKRIVAKMAMELEVKSEMLKKLLFNSGKKRGNEKISRSLSCRTSGQMASSSSSKLLLSSPPRSTWEKSEHAYVTPWRIGCQ